MNGAGLSRRDAFDQRITAHEDLTAEHLDVIRDAREQCESYGQEMSRHAHRIEEACEHDDPKNYLVQRRLGARRELGTFVGRLVREHTEMLDEAERELSVRAEEEQDRLRREKASASWD